ncbi:hypothetical protein HGRIS_002778 [Hohenbuehelia grisea]|uniref:Uncharacterized protein n=1 Tax=Hohenbuehelia grisea TaxID=104357 RepID=A0ABR3JLF9_9AGAR
MYRRVALRSVPFRKACRAADSSAPSRLALLRALAAGHLRFLSTPPPDSQQQDAETTYTPASAARSLEVSENPFSRNPFNTSTDAPSPKAFADQLVASLVQQNTVVELPPPVNGWPTPWITKAEFNNYLYPLYHHAWGVHFVIIDRPSQSGSPPEVDAPSSADNKPAPNERVSQLWKSYPFCDFDAASSFVVDATKLMKQEKHHASIHLGDQGQNTVAFHMHTHSARAPPHLPRQHLDAPGITCRDLRLAVLLDRQYTNHYQNDGRAPQESPPVQDLKFRPAWYEYALRLRRIMNGISGAHIASVSEGEKQKGTHQLSKRKRMGRNQCRACGEAHHVMNCPDRHTIPPPQPCFSCNGNHWRCDCPVSNKQARRPTSLRAPKPNPEKRAEDACSICGANHRDVDCTRYQAPPEPCPNCGGNHWRSDCQGPPRVSSKFFHNLKLPID